MGISDELKGQDLDKDKNEDSEINGTSEKWREEFNSWSRISSESNASSKRCLQF